MASIALTRTDVIVGVDTHKDQHVAVTLEGLGGRLPELFVAATQDQRRGHSGRSGSSKSPATPP